MDKDYLLKKWLKGELTEAEKKAFEKSPDYPLNKKIIEGAKQFKASHFSSPPNYEEFKSTLSSKKRTPYFVKSIQPFLRMAAILVIGFLLMGYIISMNNVKISTLPGEKKTVLLPDASIVILNSASEIQYNKLLWSVKRKVNLFGEAFFKVQKGSKFDVVTNKGIVSVVGTQFDVKSRQNIFEVKCFEGVVKVKTKNIVLVLTKGKAIKLLQNKLIEETIHETKPEWLNNKTLFKSVPLSEVIDELGRQYGMDIQAVKVNLNQKFTGGFVHDDLNQALKAITVPFNLTYEIDKSNKRVIISVK